MASFYNSFQYKHQKGCSREFYNSFQSKHQKGRSRECLCGGSMSERALFHQNKKVLHSPSWDTTFLP